MPLPFSRRCLPLALCLAFVAGLCAAAQDAPRPAAKAPVFEVVSIKPNQGCNSGSMRPILTPGHAEIACVNTRTLIRLAHGTFTGSQLSASKSNVVGGPAWLDSDYYQLAGKTSGPATAEEILGPMFREVLENRFKLKLHKEPRENSVYFLTAEEGASRLPRTKDGSCAPMDIFTEATSNAPRTGAATCGFGRGRGNGQTMVWDWPGVTMEEFAGRMLSNYVDRPVVDKTGLTGRFDLHFEFAPPRPEVPVMLNGQMVTLPPAEDSGPTIFTVLQKQLGLKLAPGKAPIDVIVVDSIERPSEN